MPGEGGGETRPEDKSLGSLNATSMIMAMVAWPGPGSREWPIQSVVLRNTLRRTFRTSQQTHTHTTRREGVSEKPTFLPVGLQASTGGGGTSPDWPVGIGVLLSFLLFYNCK